MGVDLDAGKKVNQIGLQQNRPPAYVEVKQPQAAHQVAFKALPIRTRAEDGDTGTGRAPHFVVSGRKKGKGGRRSRGKSDRAGQQTSPCHVVTLRTLTWAW